VSDPSKPLSNAGARGVFNVVEMGASVFLRPPDDKDEDEFLAMVAASRDLHSHWIHAPSSAHEFAEYLARSHRRSQISFLVCRLPEGDIAGVYNLLEVSRWAKTAFCSYFVHAAFAGQGLMAEGLQLLLRQAFGPLALQAVGASIQPGNEASIRLVQRAGFRQEKAPPRYLRLAGVMRGHPTWSITAEYWRYLAGEAQSR
jgi:ribosomal-protein-alanine N-acetyltransferase